MTSDEYAVLVIKSETRDSVRRDDGNLDWVDAMERNQLLRDARASYQAAYDDATRAHGAAVRDHETAIDGDLSRDVVAWEAALEAHYRGAPYPGPPPGFGPQDLGRLASPFPPNVPPELTDDQAALRASGVRRRSCWSATLTTREVLRQEMAVAAAGPVNPPPEFVTLTLNAVAADGWTVHHVAEDRAMYRDEVRLVSVRYLLRRGARP